MEFSSTWSSKPFILTKPVLSWLAYKIWDNQTLLSQYGSVKFRAESVDWTLNSYIQYMHNTTDESPLYLFDRSFVSKMDLSTSTPLYTPPACFGSDLFSVLGDDRPDDKWLILGPDRSGSTYHKDVSHLIFSAEPPNSTPIHACLGQTAFKPPLY